MCAFAKQNQLLLHCGSTKCMDTHSSPWPLPSGLWKGFMEVLAASKGRSGFVVTCHSLQVLPATSNDRSELVLLSERQRQLTGCNHKHDFGLFLLYNSSFTWGNGCNFIKLRSLLSKNQKQMNQYIDRSLCGGSWAGAPLEAGWSQGLPFTICCN